MPYAPRDRTFTGPVSVDPRRDARIWSEAVRNEKAFFQRANGPKQLAAGRGGNNLRDIQQLTAQLELCSADYLWTTHEVASPVSVTAALPPQTSAMAELAMGIGDAETSFMRRPANATDSLRRAATEQVPTMAPWQMGTDCAYWRHDALDRWNARQRANVLKMPEMPKRVPRAEPTISGPHAGSVAAWRRCEVPLSQWEISERGEALVSANTLAQTLGAQRSKASLNELLSTAMRVSEQQPSPARAKWHER